MTEQDDLNPSSPAMELRLLVARKALQGALGALKKASRTKLPYEVLLSFEAGILRLRGLGMAVELPAEGAADCEVRVESGKLLGLARLLPDVDPLPLIARDGKLQLGPLSMPCSTSPRQAEPIYLPVHPGLLELLALGQRHSPEEIDQAGFGQAYREAEERCEALVDKAAEVLEPLGVSREKVAKLVANHLRGDGSDGAGS
jgi:hypothetical protein